MIISHKHKFIFLKTRKTAGTSIELALSKVCGPDDIITPVSKYDEPKREELGSRAPQNFLVPIFKYNIKDWTQSFRQMKRRRFYNHISASEIRRWIGQKTWDSYFKFCVERNPWDKAISRYSFVNTLAENKMSMEDFLNQDAEIPKLTNHALYTIDGQLAVDRVCRYENLSQELEEVYKLLNLPDIPPLPNAKGGFRKDRRPYQEVLNAKEKELIQTICQKEIDLFGYIFED